MLVLVAAMAMPAWACATLSRIVDAWQERAYVGRGNANEPLFHMHYVCEDAENGDDVRFSFTPYFDGDDINALRLYLRARPTADDKAYWKSGAEEYDLGVFDSAQPLYSPGQRVAYMGQWPVADGEELASGQEITVNLHISPETFARIGVDAQNPHYYIYVTAYVSEDAVESTGSGSGFSYNAVGAVINSIDARYSYTKTTGSAWRPTTSTVTEEVTFKARNVASSGLPAHDSSAMETPSMVNVAETKGGSWTKPTYTYDFYLDGQHRRSRRVLKERRSIFLPFDGYSNFYRIPGLFTAVDGTLVLTADARKLHNHDCNNDFDVISMRSRDNGHTWETEPTIIAQGKGLLDVDGKPTSNSCGSGDIVRGYGDACLGSTVTARHMVAAFISGHGFFQHGSVKDGPQIWYTTTGNAGHTWAAPRQIPQELFENRGNEDYASTSPGRMVYVTSGPLAGKTIMVVYQRRSSVSNALPLVFLAYDELKDKWECFGTVTPPGLKVPSESQLVQLTDDTFLMSSRDDGDSGAPTKWYRVRLNASGRVDSGSFTRLSEGGSTFGNGAGTCNSNLVIYNFTDGSGAARTLLIQAKPIALNSGYLNNSNARYRSTVYMKYCEITDALIAGTDNTMRWAEGMNMSLGQAIAGYSCVTVQSDGTIGLAVEEYPKSFNIGQLYNREYDPSTCAAGLTDALLSMTYYNTTIENLSNGEITLGEVDRAITAPTIDPPTGFIVPDITDRYIFSSNNKYFNEAGDITVDESKIKLAENDYYRIKYYVRFYDAEKDEWRAVRLSEDSQTTETIGGEDQYIAYSEPNSPVRFNFRTLMDIAGRTHFNTYDRLDVFAITELWDKNGKVMESKWATEHYTVRVPTRRLRVTSTPEGAGRAHFESMSYDNEGEIRYYPVGEDINMFGEAYLGNSFVYFEVNHPTLGWVRLRDGGMLTKTQPSNPIQRVITIPDDEVYSYNDVIEMRAVFTENLGGLHIQAQVVTNAGVDLVTDKAVYCSEPGKANFDHVYRPATDPNFVYDQRNYTTYMANGSDRIEIPAEYDYDNIHLEMRLTPDFYAFKRSAIVAVWYRDAVDTDAAADLRPYILLSDDKSGETGGRAFYRNIRGYNTTANIADYPSTYPLADGNVDDSQTLRWSLGTTPQPVSFNLPIRKIERIGQYYGNTFGYVVIYLVDHLLAADDVEAMLRNDLLAANASTVMRYSFVDDFNGFTEKIAAENGEAPALASRTGNVNYAGSRPYFRRIMLPVTFRRQLQPSGIDGVDGGISELEVTAGEGCATFTGAAAFFTVYDSLGRAVGNVDLTRQDSVTLPLAPGIYAIAGKKFRVR